MFSKKEMIKLMIPLVLEQILNATVGMADTLMVSAVGESAISGVSLVDNINTLLYTLFSALCNGGAIITAHFIGSHREEDARNSAANLIFSSGVVAFILGIVALAGNKFFISLFYGSIEQNVMHYARIYFFFSAFAYVFIALYNSCSSLFRVMGITRVSLLASVMANIINICGNALFLFVFNWGVVGIALATLIAKASSAMFMVSVLTKQDRIVYLDLKKIFRPSWGMIKQIMSIGIPNGIESSLFQIGKVLVSGITAMLGTTAVAANAVAGTITNFAIIPGTAVSLAITTVVGQIAGAGDNKLAVKKARTLLLWSYLCMGITCMLLFALCPYIVSLYNLEEVTKDLALEIIKFFSIVCLLLWSPSFIIPSALRAVKEVKYTMVVSIASMWIWRILLAYVFAIHMDIGILGVWMAMGVDWLCRSICFYIRFFHGKWQNRPVLEPERENV
ncbi:transport protein [Thermoclostridium stercorarium subsp. stercorarium DSM 8532]|uniref:Probable multidrug resistance protein NorM n=2 Tax=Thermoclostridium stercorarium TaxID=1510 RepID=L7VLS8_THES1|nr:MATE family efflux transporter [Thermoclostridium stercorarium]AGC67471.1 transport protein [Thermoclostridium stercorarium subsp. stercorarium DSM 8532]AGI38527.1 efflux protein [Thermoclostridium stercorarium subsp. stercorarium DSM 8532]